MAQSRQNAARKTPTAAGGDRSRKQNKNTKPTATATAIATARGRGGRNKPANDSAGGYDNDDRHDDILGGVLPLKLQQLMLDVFKAALLTSAHSPSISSSSSSSSSQPGEQPGRDDSQGGGQSQSQAYDSNNVNEKGTRPSQNLNVKSLIQTIKSHLYNRDFDAAFTDAGEDLLRAYALRWSAARALGYAGIFKSVFTALMSRGTRRRRGRGGEGEDERRDVPGDEDDERGRFRLHDPRHTNHVVCIGGGAGAEIVALAGAWRDIMDERETKEEDLASGLDTVSLDETTTAAKSFTRRSESSALAITAVDIADWSVVVDRLSRSIKSLFVPGSKTYPTPLIRDEDIAASADDRRDGTFSVRFRRADVLSLPDEALQDMYSYDTTVDADADDDSVRSPAVLVTLMFTLNELFSTSMAKATAFLLRTTDLLQPGTILLVVDSPGSYSTVRLGSNNNPSSTSKRSALTSSSSSQERQYPMKFLLDHTLLSVAAGRWEKILSQDSRWWRRDAANLRYDVGEGAGLEDMRYQVHVYRRLAG